MSWVAYLFNPAQATRTSFAPSNDQQPPIFSNVQDYEDGSNNTYGEGQAGKHAQSMEEEEEEYPRHPYWQVSQHPIAQDPSALAKSVMN